MKLFKSSPAKFAALFASVAVLGLASQSASALTTAGTSVTNTATLSYSVGGSPQATINSSPNGNTSTGGAGTPTSFVVDRKVDFTVTGGALMNVTPGQSAVAGAANTGLQYSVTNNGNAPQSFNLTPSSPAGNTFVPAGFSVYVQATSGVLNTTTATLLTPTSGVYAVSNVAAAGTQYVYVVANIPNTNAAATALLNGNQALVQLSVQATVPTGVSGVSAGFGSGTLTPGAAEATTAVSGVANATGGANVNLVDTVLANAATVAIAATTGTGATPAIAAIAANTGTATAVGTYKIATAPIVVSKVATPICDGVSGTTNPMNIPGAAVQYAITMWNPKTDVNGNAVTTAASLTNVVDVLNAALALDPNMVTGSTAAPFCVGTAANANALNGVGYTLAYSATAAGAAGVQGPMPAVAASPATKPLAMNVNAATAGATITITPSNILTAGFAPAAGYVANAGGPATRVNAGDLLPGEMLTVYFNAIIQ